MPRGDKTCQVCVKRNHLRSVELWSPEENNPQCNLTSLSRPMKEATVSCLICPPFDSLKCRLIWWMGRCSPATWTLVTCSLSMGHLLGLLHYTAGQMDKTEPLCSIVQALRGCPHITSANFRGFQTPPPPLVSNRQQLPYPPSPPRQQSSAFGLPPPPPPAADVICGQPLSQQGGTCSSKLFCYS